MSTDEQTQFLQQLAEDLNSRNITLPSFPDVVIKIRTALEDPTCSSERLADVVRTDAVLVARLLMAANSAFHNRAGIEIVDLNLAISRLGFEVVRNTAITLAVEQIFNASQHAELRESIKSIWSSSLSLASMCFVIARNSDNLNPDNAFLCGLLHEVGKLYILTKARDYPTLMGDADSLASVLEQWYSSVGKSIVEAWGFSDEIANSMEIEENLSSDSGSPATLVDVIYAARLVLENSDEQELDESSQDIVGKLKISQDTLPAIRDAYDQHAQSMRQSVS
ncbi:MAG: HDOD domain-containing protein [Gammaproteobacteria bacterium]|nr:HDOD domain-containing protein [Gammaproteobacteria bacterium]MDH3431200.1 HDOD domain-containing protein [Gammaproteobacteria bacterium]